MLDFVDRIAIEPMVRRRFPEPDDRRICARTVRDGGGDLRFLCLPGAFCLDASSTWAGWIRLLGRHFPNAEIVVLNGFYFYWDDEVRLIEKIIDLGKATLSDKRPTYVLAFSFGGLLAKSIVTKQENQAVRAVVTMATEHRGHLPRIATTRDVYLGVPMDVEVPLYTFGGLFDPIVWPWTAFTERSRHRTLAAGHFSFMRSSAIRSKVLADLHEIVVRHQER